MKIIIVGGMVEQWLTASSHSKSVVGSHPQASWARYEFACTPHACMFSPPSVSWDWLQPPNNAAKKIILTNFFLQFVWTLLCICESICRQLCMCTTMHRTCTETQNKTCINPHTVMCLWLCVRVQRKEKEWKSGSVALLLSHPSVSAKPPLSCNSLVYIPQQRALHRVWGHMRRVVFQIAICNVTLQGWENEKGWKMEMCGEKNKLVVNWPSDPCCTADKTQILSRF